MGEIWLTQSRGTESLTTVLVREIAEQEGVDPIYLSPSLITAINLDSLEGLFSGDQDGFVRVEFTYADQHITIEGDEDVLIEVT